MSVVYFEYHAVGAWRSSHLKTLVEQMDAWEYDCWFVGKTGTWRITGCWDERYEFKVGFYCIFFLPFFIQLFPLLFQANSRVICAVRTRAHHRWIFESLKAHQIK